MLQITTDNGQSIESGIIDLLSKLMPTEDAGPKMQESLVDDVREHVSARYPGSSHYDPEKVQPGEVDRSEATVDIDIPGISRAYHDIDIIPRKSNYLTIPLRKDASQVAKSSKTFIVHKNNKKFVATKTPAGLAYLFYLSKHVHQNQDSSLMPSDDLLANNIFKEILDMG